MAQDYEYVDSSDMNSFLMNELQNQKLTEEQRQAIADATLPKEKLIAILKTVHDPEIPVNIWDLGLVYNMDITNDNDITVEMTLTAPTCPVAEAIPVEVEKRIKEHFPNVGTVKAQLVWEPAWTRDMMSEEAKLILDMW